MSHKFGNIDSWTKDKLIRIEKYLNAYVRVLKNTNFTREYIDAFAGSGYVTRKVENASRSLFEEDETYSLRDIIDGSARLALQTNPPFDRYTFIEKHDERCSELLKLKEEFPSRATAIEIICGDANENVMRLCQQDWIRQNRRGVMFLDPYGAQVHWETIATIAATKAIDLWILFPIGTVNRLLNRDGRIKEGRKRRLDMLFGEEAWIDIIYDRVERSTLYSDEPMHYFVKTKDPFGAIQDYFIKRLQTVFTEVATNPLSLKNSSNTPIFMLCFAAGNPKGASTAVKIAKDILGKA